jgi:hypothetical protein
MIDIQEQRQLSAMAAYGNNFATPSGPNGNSSQHSHHQESDYRKKIIK